MKTRPRPKIYPAKPSEKAYSWFVEQFGSENAADEFTKRYGDDADEFLPEVEEPETAKPAPKETPPEAPKEPSKTPEKKSIRLKQRKG